MTVNRDSILNMHINDQEIDLTPFIDLNKTMYLIVFVFLILIQYNKKELSFETDERIVYCW